MSTVNTTTIVDEMQDLIEQVKVSDKIDLEKKIRLITSCTDRQLRAGSLTLGYQRAVSRLPEGSAGMVPRLNAPQIE